MNNSNIIPGIGVGPMTDKYEIKILICYMLFSVRTPLTKEQINYVFRHDELVNYFSFCEALRELLESGHLTFETPKEVYTLNQLGIETAQKLSRSLPQSLRDNVVNVAMNMLADIKKARENEVIIRPCSNGFCVNCIIHDDGFDLLKLDIFAPDMLQANIIKERFLVDPTKIYKGVITSLIEGE